MSAVGGPLRGVWRWWRWEASRRIEVTPVIRLITVERFLKGLLLIAGGAVLIGVAAGTDLHSLADRIHTEYNLEPGRHLIRRLLADALDRLGSHPDVVGVGAILYGLLEVVEGVALVLRRRWAEYLVVIATGAFLPVEIIELLSRPTPLKVLGFLVNVGILAYLVWRKHLFAERPGTTEPA